MSEDLFSVSGKVAIVTGGMGQLGRQFSMALAERGAKVVVLDQRIEPDRAKKQFGNVAPRISFLTADITQKTALESALRKILGRLGTPEVLVNNAGLDSSPDGPAGDNGPFENVTEAAWDKVMAVNLKGAFLCCQVFGSAMAKAGRGSIINISSIYGLVSPDQRIYEYRRTRGQAFFKPVAYSASKAGLVNLTRYLATYWASDGVRVNTLTFAGVFNNQDERFLQSYCNKVPLGRMAREDEYNGAVIFLASKASSYMTGSNLVLDGGFTVW